ncbi:MAG: sulfatase-like hydrolase/transferase [Verrucomicrobia bacterium]|nr:sulfatase-like hydrolase/transferase [Verrucomicrobiota bacterium]
MSTKTLFSLITLLAFGLSMPSQVVAQDQQASRPPNIVFILADDLGIGDLGAYGGESIKTPHIDKLAESGVRCTAGYVSNPVCSPSRAGLITGRYQQRHGWEFNPSGQDSRTGMSTDERTFADELKALGYVTGMVGKWHLGKQDQHHPMNRGFDEYFGLLEGASIYIDSRVPGVEYSSRGGEPGPTTRPNKILRGFEEVNVERYLTDVFTDEAVAFIARHSNEPFLLYLSHITPHTPLQATKHYLDRYRHLEDPGARIYAAMVAALDDSVGRVVEQLKAIDQYENTLIVFLSDNGCAGYLKISCCSNQPYFGYKRYHNEGGIRIPFILSWPAKLPAGKVYDAPVISLDLLATFTAAAGQVKTTEDSVNLLPFFTGERAGIPHEYLYWRTGPTIAIREQSWKLIRYNRFKSETAGTGNTGLLRPPEGGWSNDSPHGQATLLYDILKDPGETTNLAGKHPDVVRRLSKEHARWVGQLKDPILSCNRSTVVEIDGETIQLFF